jgi:DNA invertase Pin-like site-specific DNA recombinase
MCASLGHMKFEDVLKYYGSRNKIAKALGCSRQNITRWAYDGVPKVRQYEIEEKSRGKLKREEREKS